MIILSNFWIRMSTITAKELLMKKFLTVLNLICLTLIISANAGSAVSSSAPYINRTIVTPNVSSLITTSLTNPGGTSAGSGNENPSFKPKVNDGTYIRPVLGSNLTITKRITSDHYGIDISYKNASTSDIQNHSTRQIVTSNAGIVVKVFSSCNHQNQRSLCLHNQNTGFGGYGNFVLIKHSDEIFTLYAHLIQDSVAVEEGMHVIQGQYLGLMGNSGNVWGSTGIHLHFEMRSGNWPETNFTDLKVLTPLNYISLP
jgi:hypothetical protein